MSSTDNNGPTDDDHNSDGTENNNPIDPDDSDEICEDTHETKIYCRNMKKNGCKRRDLAKKNCRKSCDLCGKITIFEAPNYQ